MSNSVNTVETNIEANSEADVKSETDQIQDETDLAVEALIQLNNGKRDLLVGDYSSAVNSFQESCQLFDQKYGIGAEECGDAYLYYGTALLELARLEDGIFDGTVHTKLTALSDTEEEEEEGDDDEEGNESQDNEESSDKKSEEKKTDTEEDIGDSDEEKKKLEAMKSDEVEEETAAQESSNVSEPSTCLPSTSKSSPNEENKDENEDNDASNLEVSWEVLSLAKHVFLKSKDKPGMKLKLSEALQKLGEISIEWENNQKSIQLLTESLALRKELLSEDDRLIAETYYHLGLAFSFSNDCENANNCFQSAIQVIEARIVNLRKKISESNDENNDSNASIEREITQLEMLLPEMRLKIEDSKDQMENARKALEDEKDEKVKEDAIALKSQEVKEKPITDISHLIKRKRQNSDTETTPKKVCSNGHNLMNDDKSSDQTNPST